MHNYVLWPKSYKLKILGKLVVQYDIKASFGRSSWVQIPPHVYFLDLLSPKETTYISPVHNVENHWIFLGYFLVYLLPFLCIIFLPFCILFCFLFVQFFCIYIGFSILCNTHSFNKEKNSFILSFHMVSESWLVLE